MAVNRLGIVGAVLVVAFRAAPSWGAEFRVPLMARPPKLDGRIEEGEWAVSAGFAGFAMRGQLERRRITARVGATPTHLFVAFQSQLPEEGQILARVQNDTVKVVYDDSVEVWVDPTPGAEHGDTYQMLANPVGCIGYKHHSRGRTRERPTWRGKWKLANGFHGGYWHCEVGVPLAEIAPGRTADQGAWGINLCRNWKQPWAFSSLGGGPYAPEGMRFTFSKEDALAIQHRTRGDPITGDLKMALRMTNPTAKPIAVKAEMAVARDAMPTLRADDTLTIAPGETERLSFDTKDEATRKFKLAIFVHSVAGKRIHYSRSYAWKAAKPWRWTTKKKKVLPIDLQFAYYPYRGKMRVIVDTSNLPGDAQVKRLVITVRQKGGGPPLKRIEFVDGAAKVEGGHEILVRADRQMLRRFGIPTRQLAEETMLPLSLLRSRMSAAGRSMEVYERELLSFPIFGPEGRVIPLREVAQVVIGPATRKFARDGRRYAVELDVPFSPLTRDYEVAVKAHGTGVPAGELVKEFDRRVYEWERKGLGTSRKVYPPFTSIKVAGRKLSTVLREHTLNGFGLWDQVVARGKPLLAGPMRFAAQSDGKNDALRPRMVHVSTAEPDRAIAHAAFHGRSVSGRAMCQWDYDGMMRMDMLLRPGAAETLESFRLEIPFRADTATLFHAMGDGIRNTVYTRVPDGEGVVWTSEKVAVNDFPPNFCSYIYVGTPVRGLCWFAENDKGWSWDPKKPNVDLVRKGDQLILRIHFVNRPTKLDGPRILTFGLLAAPVKPRIENWRYIWRRENYTLLGTDINWLARGDCGSVYPAGKDMYLWEMIKRGNREKLSNEQIQKVVDHGRKYFEPYGPARVESYERHVRHNLRSRHGKKMVFYYNRASCQLFPEFQTFQDEWCLTDYRTVGAGKGIGEIKIVPTDSYIDHALYWYGKSFDIGGNQGVYWDNYFFCASHNTAMTAAYRRPDGSWMPSTGIWGLRELARRTFVYMNECGVRPITMVHMTSTGILPVYSFCTVQYDWEWKYSQGDFQYRFPREYILLVTTGELAGAWPVLLGDHGKLGRDEWTQRTFAGVCLVHELDGWGGGKAWGTLFKHVHRLVETPGLDVYRYWDDRRQPIVANHPDLPTIVYSLKGKEALLAVTSYADKDLSATIAIDPAALGLAEGYRIVDAETGQSVAANGNKLPLRIRKHDVRAFRLLPRE